MGTEPAGHRDATAPPGAGPPGAGPGAARPGGAAFARGPGRAAGQMRAGYTQPERVITARSLRRLRWVLGTVTVVLFAGLALLLRLVYRGYDGETATGTAASWLPSGLGWVTAGLGLLALVLGAAVYVRGTTRRNGTAAGLPRQVRRAVRRREAVPERYRDRVPAWLDRMRGYGVTVTGQAVSTCGLLLVANAGNDPSAGHVLRDAAVLGGTYLVLFGVPLAGYLWWLERLRRHHAAADTGAQRRS